MHPLESLQRAALCSGVSRCWQPQTWAGRPAIHAPWPPDPVAAQPGLGSSSRCRALSSFLLSSPCHAQGDAAKLALPPQPHAPPSIAGAPGSPVEVLHLPCPRREKPRRQWSGDKGPARSLEGETVEWRSPGRPGGVSGGPQTSGTLSQVGQERDLLSREGPSGCCVCSGGLGGGGGQAQSGQAPGVGGIRRNGACFELDPAGGMGCGYGSWRQP